MTGREQRLKAYTAASAARDAGLASDDLGVRRVAVVASIAAKLAAAPKVDGQGRPLPDDDPDPGGSSMPLAA